MERGALVLVVVGGLLFSFAFVCWKGGAGANRGLRMSLLMSWREVVLLWMAIVSFSTMAWRETMPALAWSRRAVLGSDGVADKPSKVLNLGWAISFEAGQVVGVILPVGAGGKDGLRHRGWCGLRVWGSDLNVSLVGEGDIVGFPWG